MFLNPGGVKNVRLKFMAQLKNVAIETTLLRIWRGTISVGLGSPQQPQLVNHGITSSTYYIHPIGPQVGAYVAMNRYEQAIMAFDGPGCGTIQVTVDTSLTPPGTA
jgi:hypothetical protein